MSVVLSRILREIEIFLRYYSTQPAQDKDKLCMYTFSTIFFKDEENVIEGHPHFGVDLFCPIDSDDLHTWFRNSISMEEEREGKIISTYSVQFCPLSKKNITHSWRRRRPNHQNFLICDFFLTNVLFIWRCVKTISQDKNSFIWIVTSMCKLVLNGKCAWNYSVFHGMISRCV